MTKPLPINVAVLQDWAVVHLDSNWAAPEAKSTAVSGVVVLSARPELRVGARITTNAIVSVRSRVVVTATGSEYYLTGHASKEYRAWLKEHGLEYHPETPIELKPPSPKTQKRSKPRAAR